MTRLFAEPADSPEPTRTPPTLAALHRRLSDAVDEVAVHSRHEGLPAVLVYGQAGAEPVLAIVEQDDQGEIRWWAEESIEAGAVWWPLADWPAGDIDGVVAWASEWLAVRR
jgi:hypothetical protein